MNCHNEVVNSKLRKAITKNLNHLGGSKNMRRKWMDMLEKSEKGLLYSMKDKIGHNTSNEGDTSAFMQKSPKHEDIEEDFRYDGDDYTQQ